MKENERAENFPLFESKEEGLLSQLKARKKGYYLSLPAQRSGANKDGINASSHIKEGRE